MSTPKLELKNLVNPPISVPIIKSKKRQMLIVSDLDGTLLNDNGDVSNETVRVVKELQNCGHLFCIATGRTPRGSQLIYNKLGLNTISVNLNGSYIWHPKKVDFMPINIVFNKKLVNRLMDKPAIMKRIDNIIVENKEGTYILNKPVEKHEIIEFNKWFHIDVNAERSNFFGHKHMKDMQYDPNTVLLQIKNPKNIDDVIYYLKQSFNTFVVRSWSLQNSGNIIEINTTYANKGNAIDFLESYYGIEKDSTIAFGDGENDIELIQKVRFGYAMKNGSPTAKLVARYITRNTNVHDGVAFELCKKVLSKLEVKVKT